MKTYRVNEVGSQVPVDVQGTRAKINEHGDLEIWVEGVVDGWIGTSKLVRAWSKGAWTIFREMEQAMREA